MPPDTVKPRETRPALRPSSDNGSAICVYIHRERFCAVVRLRDWLAQCDGEGWRDLIPGEKSNMNLKSTSVRNNKGARAKLLRHLYYPQMCPAVS